MSFLVTGSVSGCCGWWPCSSWLLGSLLSCQWATIIQPFSQQVSSRLPLLFSVHMLFMTEMNGSAVQWSGSAEIPVNKSSQLVGCRYPPQDWCLTVPKIYLFQYAIALFLLAIGYPMSCPPSSATPSTPRYWAPTNRYSVPQCACVCMCVRCVCWCRE